MSKEKDGIQRLTGLPTLNRGFAANIISYSDLRRVPEDARRQFRHNAYKCDYGKSDLSVSDR